MTQSQNLEQQLLIIDSLLSKFAILINLEQLEKEEISKIPQNKFACLTGVSFLRTYVNLMHKYVKQK
jgi:hypothetical protein